MRIAENCQRVKCLILHLYLTVFLVIIFHILQCAFHILPVTTSEGILYNLCCSGFEMLLWVAPTYELFQLTDLHCIQ